MRRLLVLMMAASVATAFVGCGSGSSTAPTTGEQPQMKGGKAKHTFEAPPPIQPVK
ncbi:MAG TPA: hypothetical protein VFG68_22300 [Fimbriiglobus sp.]|nr:hypothetical protein [Fimbriiglobus sp.]